MQLDSSSSSGKCLSAVAGCAGGAAGAVVVSLAGAETAVVWSPLSYELLSGVAARACVAPWQHEVTCAPHLVTFSMAGAAAGSSSAVLH